MKETDETTTPEDQVRCALQNAVSWFLDYKRQHSAKGTADGDQKAEINRARALVLAQALSTFIALYAGHSAAQAECAELEAEGAPDAE
jgi:hypothetical protein